MACELALGSLAGLGSAAAAEVIATDLRVGQQADGRTRFVLELTKQVEFRVFTLADPYRLVVDLPEVGWQLPQRPLPAATGLFKTLRYGLFKPGHSRIVLEVKAPAAVATAFLLQPTSANGYRLVLDFAETSDQAFTSGLRQPPLVIATAVPAEPAAPLAASPAPVPTPSAKLAAAPPPAAERAPRKPETPKKRQKRLVVIDPGHGGADPGTVGVSGIYEKDITLAVALEMKSLLEGSGRYRIQLTRDRDVFMRLRDRVSMAREARADLFLSIHADAIKNRGVTGPSVYTLSETASDQEAADLAEKENKADLIAGLDLSHETPEVTSILIDLAQRETMNESARFAGGLIQQLRGETAVLRNTHRFAGFAVLKAPDVPSVLLELGFLSNPEDERNLKLKKYRMRLANAALRAVDAYFSRVEETHGK